MHPLVFCAIMEDQPNHRLAIYNMYECHVQTQIFVMGIHMYIWEFKIILIAKDILLKDNFGEIIIFLFLKPYTPH